MMKQNNLELSPETKLDGIMSQIKDLEATLTNVSNIKQLSNLLSVIDETQSDIDCTLQSFCMKNKFSHQSTIRSLEISRLQLSSTLNQSRNLKNIMSDANDLSYKITERVRLLDIEKNQLINLKTYIDNVKTLKMELSRANDAIERNDWKIASESISIIRNLPDGLINDSFVEFKVPSSNLEDLPSDLLNRWIKELEVIFVNEFNDAATKKDVNKLTEYFQLFPLIGKPKVGLQYYSKFICSIISEQSRSIIRSAQNKDSKTEFYSQLLFRLYQTISTIVNQHSKVIKLYYGGDVVNDILKEIQMECDLQSNLIFETYSDSKNLDRSINDIQQYDYPILIQQIYNNADDTANEEDEDNIQETVELIEVSKITDELSAMMNHWSMYSKFFVVVWNNFLQNSDKVSDDKYTGEIYNNINNIYSRNIYPAPLIYSTFGIKISDVIVRKFDIFCTYTIRRTLEKACTIETLNSLLPQLTTCLNFLTSVFKKIDNSMSNSLFSLLPEEPPISSLADDIIIVLNTILLETLTTGELTTIKNMVSNIKRVLLNDFLNIIQQRLKLNLKPSSNLITKETIRKIHRQQNPLIESPLSNSSNNSPNRSSTPIGGINVSASDIANTGAMFMRGLNAAISYTMTGDETNDSTFFLGDDTEIKQYIIYLNTLSAMNSYLEKMVESCLKNNKTRSLLIIDDQELSQIRKSTEKGETITTNMSIPILNDNVIYAKIEKLLNTIPNGFKERTDMIIENNVKLIFERIFKIRVLRLINDAIEDSYMVSLEDGEFYSIDPINNSNNVNNAANGTTANTENNNINKIFKFIKNWNSLIVPYVTTLAPDIFAKLITKIIELSAIVLENKIWKLEKKVSGSGAFKLEQDISNIIGELTKFNYNLRSKFLKVTQIIMVVGLDEDEDISVLEELDESMEWALTPSERTRARRLRG